MSTVPLLLSKSFDFSSFFFSTVSYFSVLAVDSIDLRQLQAHVNIVYFVLSLCFAVL